MPPLKPLESDWKLFSKRLGDWRERYLEGKTLEIAESLLDKTRTPTGRFWDTYETMRSEARLLRDCLDGRSRSRMWMMMTALYGNGFVDEEDLEEFSAELREHVLAAFRDR